MSVVERLLIKMLRRYNDFFADYILYNFFHYIDMIEKNLEKPISEDKKLVMKALTTPFRIMDVEVDRKNKKIVIYYED